MSVAAPAYAGVAITEIMYDLDGPADTGREWVEIQNTGASPADITDWKFFENGTNHGLTLISGNAALQPNSFAIIADNAEKFLIDWPGFSGTLFDSSFSLSNTGETLALRTPELVDADAVTYSSDWGAQGNGKSLQKIGNEWAAASPTPGTGGDSQTPPANPSAGEDSNSGGGGPVEMADSTSKIKASAGEDRTVLAGAEVIFEGSAEGFVGATADKIRFHWNFGDGKTGEGNKIAHAFSYPGVYSVFLAASFAGASASDSVKITVIENPVVVSEIQPGQGGWLEIYNSSPRKVDFSNFGVQVAGGKIFYFPENTFLAPHAYVVVAADTIGFEIPKEGEMRMVYPNGKVLLASAYHGSGVSLSESASFIGGAWAQTKATPGAKNEFVKKLALSSAPASASSSGEPNQYASQTASVINIESPAGAQAFWGGNYFWLFAGLGAGALAAAIFFFGKRYWA